MTCVFGSAVYPRELDLLDSNDYVIIKKPERSGGQGHIITTKTNGTRAPQLNADVQELIHPWLLDGKQFHLRISVGIHSNTIFMPWQNSLVLVHPLRYVRGDKATGITNAAEHGDDYVTYV